MAHQSTAPVRTQYGWRWVLVAVAVVSWLSIGCNPSTLSFLLLPWVDNKIEPDYKLFAKENELTLAILSNFSEPHWQPELAPAEAEIAERLAQFFRKRCQDNKHKIKIVPQTDVKAAHLKLLADGGMTPVALGKKVKADYVLDLNIQSFSLYQKDSYPRMYRGNADIQMSLHKIEVKDEDHKVFHKLYRVDYSGGKAPIMASDSNPQQFRDLFVTKIARDVSKMFVSYPPEEREIVPFE